MFNKTKNDALPSNNGGTTANAVEAASADMSWKAIDRYSKDYITLQTTDKVKFYKTPDAVLQTQLTAYDAAAAKKSGDNAIFKEIEASQKAFAERAVQVGPRHQRQSPDGVQPLLRREGGAQEVLTSVSCATDTLRRCRSVPGSMQGR